MSHWQLNDKAFYEWAVKKIAEDTRVEELEAFCETFPPDKLRHIFKVLDEKVIPTLQSEGIPISKEECYRLFRSWFVRSASTNQIATTKENTDSTQHYYFCGSVESSGVVFSC